MASYSLSPSCRTTLREEMGTVVDLPIMSQMAVLNDCLTDIAVVDSNVDTASSREDLLKALLICIRKEVVILPEEQETQMVNDVMDKLHLYLICGPIIESDRNIFPTPTVKEEKRLLTMFTVVNNTINVRVPDYDEKNEGLKKNLGKYLAWGCTMLGFETSQVKVFKTKELGANISLPTSVSRALDSMNASRNSIADVGNRMQLQSGLKCSLTELLAAIKLMRRYGGLLQKSPPRKGQETKSVSLNDMKEVFNKRVGINDPALGAFEKSFLKGIVNELTKIGSKRMPGHWISSVKVANGVKSNIGIMYKLGYDSKVISTQKLLHVLLSRPAEKEVQEKPKSTGNKTVIGKGETVVKSYLLKVSDSKENPSGATHKEARAALFGLLPVIDVKSNKSIKQQISREILDIREKDTLQFFSNQRDFVNTLNLAYATLQALSDKKSKASIEAFANLRYKLLNLSNKQFFLLNRGYIGFKDIPQNICDFVFKLVNRKRTDNESGESSDDEATTKPESPKETKVNLQGKPDDSKKGQGVNTKPQQKQNATADAPSMVSTVTTWNHKKTTLGKRREVVKLVSQDTTRKQLETDFAKRETVKKLSCFRKGFLELDAAATCNSKLSSIFPNGDEEIAVGLSGEEADILYALLMTDVKRIDLNGKYEPSDETLWD
ncbi:hypothetical protein [Ophiocordyceps sinensis ormycovirus 1]